MIVDILTIIVAALTGIAAFYLVGYFHTADQKLAVARLMESPCPYCAKTYGVDLLASVAQVTYDWTPLPGNTLGDLGLPRTTFLVTCPSCAVQTEFRSNTQVFVPPHNGLLDCSRQVRSLTITSLLPAESRPILGKSARVVHAGHKA